MEYKDEVIALASQAVMDDRIMVSHAVQIQQDTLQWYLQSVQTRFQVG